MRTCGELLGFTSLAGVPMRALSSSCTALVPFGPVGLTLNMSFTRMVRSLVHFPKSVISQLVGHLLGDGCLTISRTSTVPSFVFSQSINKLTYVWHVFMLLGHYCNKLPRLHFSHRAGTLLGNMFVITRSYPILSDLHSLFYANTNGVKGISLDLIRYLDPIALAFWAMDDGAATTSRSGFYLHTKGFTFDDVYLLVGMLHYLFGLVCTVQNHKGQPVIYITRKSLPAFISLVRPHFHPSMMYKLSVRH
uniref:Homing endonuclease LAGLIDADG domain-containing protein n=2 Tax=Agaricomycotina TaxID=5302 RepID=A0A2H4QBE2_9TREE|nr:hypothetical protein [Tremella fuciformis]YP_010180095.1 hypothetical protein LI453_mgp17 [Auricularia auricula-judae]ATX61905.1 hypothetical protein [Tremella fuciformis]ATX61926.1 hypothetical protein [Tremella fuciformis]ATX61969.1 hypothetical protein [Tremella fuciformis]ATX62037.1 hypothetical protein [Tremella fuciformis]ATX62087.1 hypothetical protein [Tremella fuciformis]